MQTLPALHGPNAPLDKRLGVRCPFLMPPLFHFPTQCVVPGTCDKCLDGFVLDNGQCTKCPAGSYAAVGSTSCTACTALTGCSSVTCSSASDSVCSSCDAGLYSDALGNCQPCTPIPGCSAVSCSSPSTQLCPTCNPGYEGDGTHSRCTH
jgi:hypothetical protein